MWGRRLSVTGGALILVVLTMLLALIFGLLRPDDSDAIAATSEVDSALYGAYSALIGNADQDFVRKSLLAEETNINTERDDPFSITTIFGKIYMLPTTRSRKLSKQVAQRI